MRVLVSKTVWVSLIPWESLIMTALQFLQENEFWSERSSTQNALVGEKHILADSVASSFYHRRSRGHHPH